MARIWAFWLVGAFVAIGLVWPGVAAWAAEGEVWPELRPAADYIRNLHVVDQGLIRGAQPNAEGFRRLKVAGVKTVINLRNEDVPVAQEGETVRLLGMRYVNIPLNVFEPPGNSAIGKFLRIASDPANQPVYVHCQFGQDRTGTMCAMYRIKNYGWTAGQSFDEMLSFGFKPGLANLTRSVYDFADQMGRQEQRPGADLIVKDLKRRLKGRMKT